MDLLILRANWRLLVIAILGGCATHRTQLPPPSGYGYIVLSAKGSEVFGIKGSDTVPELRPGRVPAVVIAAADSQAGQIRKDPRCNRYFSTGEIYIVLFSSSCRASEYLEDGRALGAYGTQGGQRGRLTQWASNYMTALEPGKRTPE